MTDFDIIPASVTIMQTYISMHALLVPQSILSDGAKFNQSNQLGKRVEEYTSHEP